MVGDTQQGELAGRGSGLQARPPDEGKHGFRDYWRVLRQHRNFRYLWIAETIDNMGSWLSYVATLELASQFSGGGGLALSAVVIIRFLPSLLLAPICGVVADRANRVRVLIVAALADAVVVALLALVQRPSQVGLLYGLLTCQFAFAAFYDPARKALTPVLVPAADLHLATTIDSFAWSITGAVGASLGGLLASRLGKQACFLADAATYVIAAWCAWHVPARLGAPDAAASQVAKVREVRLVQLLPLGERGEAGSHASARSPGRKPDLEGMRLLGVAEGGGGGEHEEHDELENGHREGHSPAAGTSEDAADGSIAVIALHPGHQPREGKRSQRQQAPAWGKPAGGSSLVAAASSAAAEGWAASCEGWKYISSQENSGVAALVLMKCTAALVWGAVDILNVQFSQLPSMQRLGDADITLGIIFATVGLGCFVGPILLNKLFSPQPGPLRWGVATSFLLFFVGLLLMLLSTSILLVLLSTFVRSTGSATLWVYSTLLMQQRVANDMLGRISAIESALFTITEGVSSIFGGAAFDVLHLSLWQLLLILTSIAGVEAAGWALFAYLVNRSSRGNQHAYSFISQHAASVMS